MGKQGDLEGNVVDIRRPQYLLNGCKAEIVGFEVGFKKWLPLGPDSCLNFMQFIFFILFLLVEYKEVEKFIVLLCFALRLSRNFQRNLLVMKLE